MCAFFFHKSLLHLFPTACIILTSHRYFTHTFHFYVLLPKLKNMLLVWILSIGCDCFSCMHACMHKCVCKRDRERKREMMLNEYQRYWAPVIWNCVSINNFDNHRVGLKLYQTMLLFFFFITNKYLVVLLQHSWQRPIEREKK